MTYTIYINYFKQNGSQHTKEISRKTIKGLINAIKKFDNQFEIYNINSVSYNLQNVKEFNEYIKDIGW